MNNIPGISALRAYGVRQEVNANNVANMNTPNFKPSRVTMEERPNRGGVQVQEIKKQDNNGLKANNRLEGGDNQAKQPSKTDLTTEFTQMIENKNAYQANAKAIKVNDQMTGEIINKLA